MFQFIKNTGKLILGFFLFVVGLGFIYLGCQYQNSMVAGIFKKLDAWMYLICFGTSIIGADMIYAVFTKNKKTVEKEVKAPEENKEPASS